MRVAVQRQTPAEQARAGSAAIERRVAELSRRKLASSAHMPTGEGLMPLIPGTPLSISRKAVRDPPTCESMGDCSLIVGQPKGRTLYGGQDGVPSGQNAPRDAHLQARASGDADQRTVTLTPSRFQLPKRNANLIRESAYGSPAKEAQATRGCTNLQTVLKDSCALDQLGPHLSESHLAQTTTPPTDAQATVPSPLADAKAEATLTSADQEGRDGRGHGTNLTRS